jgi:small-conductance mechanosensitive channel
MENLPMSAESQTVTLTVSLGDDALPKEVNRATTQLYDELKTSKADYVEKPRSERLEAGAKGDPITIGAIVLGVSVAATPGIVALINSWLTRRHLTTSVKIKLGDDEIEFPAPTAATPEELESLTDRFVALLKKHSGSKE